nr:hypothetical protein [Methanophagales archaeon]
MRKEESVSEPDERERRSSSKKKSIKTKMKARMSKIVPKSTENPFIL